MEFKYCPNIYTANLDKRCVNAAINHAKKEFPKESCGAIVNGKYIRFKNESLNPEEEFEIKDDRWYDWYMKGEIDCIIHSHNDSNQASMVDQIQQRELGIPSMIINLKNKSLMDCIVFGGDIHPPLKGRPFFWGVYDCVSLVKDYILNQFGFEIKYPAHEFDFWIKQKNYFEKYLGEQNPFIEVATSDMKKHDVLLYNIDGSRFINHIAVIISDNGEVLHHMYNNISGTYPINFNRRYLRKVMRFNGDK